MVLDKYKTLPEQVQDNTTKIEELESKITDKSDIEELEIKVATNTSDISTLKSSIDTSTATFNIPTETSNTLRVKLNNLEVGKMFYTASFSGSTIHKYVVITTSSGTFSSTFEVMEYIKGKGAIGTFFDSTSKRVYDFLVDLNRHYLNITYKYTID